MLDPLIVLSEKAAESMSQAAPASADGTETGGILLGHDAGDTITITTAGDPGPNAKRRADGFLRDLVHAQHLADEAYDRDGSVWVGEWHTHPDGPARPSSIDMSTYTSLLADPDLGFERVVSLIVVPCREHRWTELFVAPWVVDDDGAHAARLDLQGNEGHVRKQR